MVKIEQTSATQTLASFCCTKTCNRQHKSLKHGHKSNHLQDTMTTVSDCWKLKTSLRFVLVKKANLFYLRRLISTWPQNHSQCESFPVIEFFRSFMFPDPPTFCICEHVVSGCFPGKHEPPPNTFPYIVISVLWTDITRPLQKYQWLFLSSKLTPAWLVWYWQWLKN